MEILFRFHGEHNVGRFKDVEGRVLDVKPGQVLAALDNGIVDWIPSASLESQSITSYPAVNWSDSDASNIIRDKKTLSPEDLSSIRETNSQKMGAVEDHDSYRYFDHYVYLKRYVNENSQDINEALRNNSIGALDNIEKMTVYQMQGMMKPLGRPQSLFRGLGEEFKNPSGEPISVGDVFPVDTFLSASRDPNVGTEYSDGDFIELQTSPDTYGITLSDADPTYTHKESETILDLGQHAEVVDIIDDVQIDDRSLRYVKMKIHPTNVSLADINPKV